MVCLDVSRAPKRYLSTVMDSSLTVYTSFRVCYSSLSNRWWTVYVVQEGVLGIMDPGSGMTPRVELVLLLAVIDHIHLRLLVDTSFQHPQQSHGCLLLGKVEIVRTKVPFSFALSYCVVRYFDDTYR